MTRAERLRAADTKVRIARRLADLAAEHYRIGDGLMEAAQRAGDEAHRILKGDVEVVATTSSLASPERR